jgi:PAS domain S-box-containing protein
MQDGQAYVEKDRCISCGTCVRECPQKAKTYRRDIETVREMIKSGDVITASVAPSFASYLMPWERKRFIGGLRRLGFRYVEETAQAAYAVAKEARTLIDSSEKLLICTACPAAVSYAEKYNSGAAGAMMPISSPMVQHGHDIKKRHGAETKAVFIGPCIAKKEEMLRPENEGAIDAVLTFAEINEMFAENNINLKNCEESFFETVPEGLSRFYPLPGGLLKTAYGKDPLPDSIAAEGFAQVKQSYEAGGTRVIEPLFCEGGCVNGPGMPEFGNIFERKRNLLQYIKENASAQNADETPSGSVKRAEHAFTGIKSATEHSEEEINGMLEKTGKLEKGQQLNCGACGYAGCREKAIAVLDGMAEPDMCLPQMRRLAEQRTDRIIETSPNGIVITDAEMNIIRMNPAFEAMFGCGWAAGKNISQVMDPIPFEKLATFTAEKLEMTARHPKKNLFCHEIFYRIPEENQYVGIFVDITKFSESDSELLKIREETIVQARELLNHQVEMAQKIAYFLGENTAKSESLVRKIMITAGGKDEN